MENNVDLFLSRYENKIDNKGRVSIPARFRSVMKNRSGENTLLVFPSTRRRILEACDISFMNIFMEAAQKTELFSEEEERQTYPIFANCHELSVDGDGRVLLPPVLMEYALLKDSAIFVGIGQRFQIMNDQEMRRIKGFIFSDYQFGNTNS